MWPFKLKKKHRREGSLHRSTSIPLTELVLQKIPLVFAPSAIDRVAELLRKHCGSSLPLFDSLQPQDYDRIRCAVIKLSQGNEERLLRLIRSANEDWRNSLVAAGFGYLPEAHLSWRPEVNLAKLASDSPQTPPSVMLLPSEANKVRVGDTWWSLPAPVAEAIQIHERILVIFDRILPSKSTHTSNLCAYGLQQNELWQASPPVHLRTSTYMNFAATSPLTVWNFSGFMCTLDESTGKVIRGHFLNENSTFGTQPAPFPS